MRYDTMTRADLIELLNKRNNTVELLEKRNLELEQRLQQLSDKNVLELVDALEKQKKVQSQIIHDLRRGRGELLNTIVALTSKLESITKSSEVS